MKTCPPTVLSVFKFTQFKLTQRPNQRIPFEKKGNNLFLLLLMLLTCVLYGGGGGVDIVSVPGLSQSQQVHGVATVRDTSQARIF